MPIIVYRRHVEESLCEGFLGNLVVITSHTYMYTTGSIFVNNRLFMEGMSRRKRRGRCIRPGSSVGSLGGNLQQDKKR